MFQGTTQLDPQAASYSLDTAIEGARRESGLTDFGDPVFLEPLAKLIDCSLADLRFTEMGLLNFRATIQRFLVNRLRFQRDLEAHPEILAEDVSDPIIILGMPRTGTTKLQRLIAADPQMQKLYLWKLLNPAPFDGEQAGQPTGRMAFAQAVEDATRANPEFTMSHETSATAVDEDSFLALLSFDYVMLYCIFPSGSYLRWVRSRPQRTAHAFEKKMLQYLQWQDGGKRGRRWVLKNPGATGFLKILHEMFPRATFVHSHRDMTEVIPSYCRLMESIYRPLLEPIDLHRHGREVLEYWAPEVARYRKERAELEGKLQILDVPYIDVVKNPLPLVREIYRRAGVAFTEASEQAMLAWLALNRQHKYGQSNYSLERYGMTPQMIRQAFPQST